MFPAVRLRTSLARSGQTICQVTVSKSSGVNRIEASPSGTTVVKKNGSSASCSSKGTDMDRRTFLTLTLAAPALVRDFRVPLEAAPPAGIPWTQWGGPHRNFQTEATGLKDTWPTSGPRVIWKRRSGKDTRRPRSESGICTRRTASRARRSSSPRRPRPARRCGNAATRCRFRATPPRWETDRTRPRSSSAIDCSRPAWPAVCSASRKKPGSRCGCRSCGQAITDRG